MRCLMCGKDFQGSGTWQEIFLNDDLLCETCRAKWLRHSGRRAVCDIPVQSLWKYEGGFREALIQFKECGDEALQDVFMYPFRTGLWLRYRGWTLALMPSSEEKQRQRGFSHLALMAGCLKLPVTEPFVLEGNHTQKGKTAEERRQIRTYMRLRKDCNLPEKILLFDDVITTGSTLEGALELLDREKHQIRILTAASAGDPVSLNG